MITLYSKDNTIKIKDIKKFTYSGKFMGECFLSFPYSDHTSVDFEVDDYCVYRGERFTLNYDPAKKKQARAGSHGKAFEYDNIKLNSLADELTRVDFLDIVKNDSGIHYTSLPNFSFYANSIHDLADRIQANLDNEFVGERKWTVIVSPDAISTSQSVTVSNMTIWDAVALSNKLFGLNFTIRNRTITIGTAGLAVGKVFKYGKDNGLYDIVQTTNQDAKIITRIRGYGNITNMPHRYYNNLKDSNGNPYIEESAYVPNVMLSSFPYEINDPSKVYIDSVNKDVYGIRYGSVYFDGSDGKEDIYPSVEGMTKEQLAASGIVVSLPQGDNGKLDQVLNADNPADDGIIPTEGEGEIQAQFTITLKDLGFDLTEKDSDGRYKYLSTDAMQVSMKSGMCVARTFDVVENGIRKDTSLGYTRYIIECNRASDDSIGMAYPNKDWRIESGDTFVLLGINMPEVYVKAAAERVRIATEEYLTHHDETKYSYQPTISSVFMAENPQIADTIKEGDIFTFEDDDLKINASEIIQTLTIEHDLNKSPIPDYKVSLSNEKIAGRLDKMLNSITTLMSSGVGITLDQVKSLINQIGSSLFLSKNFDDIARGLIKFTKGLNVGEFTSGMLGSGATLRMVDGSSELEVDKLTVRKWARFFEVIIERMSHIGGSWVLSPARMICSRVEELDNAYRCYFETGENDEFVQEFVVNDQARCQVFTGSTQKFYWRLVEGIGKDYIDLSKSDFDSGSGIPTEGDHIFQLGHRTNKERQNAQILSSFGSDAPSYKQYQGINSYSLEGKEKTVISPSGNRFEGAMKIEAGSLGWENLVGLPEQFQDLATGAVNLIRNSGFTGDYEDIYLEESTDLKSETEMFSERLAYWDGYATVNEDSESVSEYSATLFNQEISQAIQTIFDENYVLSFKAKGETITVNVSGYTETKTLTSQYEEYVIKLKAGQLSKLVLSGRCTICEIQLERGTIKSDYSFSPLDNNKTLAQFNEIRYITDSVRNGSTTILGGLILSSMIQLGNYINGQMQSVTAGMSGVYNNDNDVAFWAGGELNKAIANALLPYTDDVSKMINFLVTHGGVLIANNAIIRGHLDATSGTIGGFDIKEGELISIKKGDNGVPMIKLNGVDGSGWLAMKNLSWDELGNLLASGRFESHSPSGNSIILDPENPSLVFKDGRDRVVGSIDFIESILGGKTPVFKLRSYDASNTITHSTTIDRMGVSILGKLLENDIEVRMSNDGIILKKNNETMFSAQYSFGSGQDLKFRFSLNLPKSSSGLESGDLWNNEGVVRIV